MLYKTAYFSVVTGKLFCTTNLVNLIAQLLVESYFTHEELYEPTYSETEPSVESNSKFEENFTNIYQEMKHWKC